jgi:hypothetical protein
MTFLSGTVSSTTLLKRVFFLALDGADGDKDHLGGRALGDHVLYQARIFQRAAACV